MPCHISGLYRVPSNESPCRMRFFTIGLVRNRAAVKRHLHLSSPVRVIDEVFVFPGIRQVRNCATQVEINSYFDIFVFNKTHLLHTVQWRYYLPNRCSTACYYKTHYKYSQHI